MTSSLGFFCSTACLLNGHKKTNLPENYQVIESFHVYLRLYAWTYEDILAEEKIRSELSKLVNFTIDRIRATDRLHVEIKQKNSIAYILLSMNSTK